MEEILASIRQIISEDGEAALTRGAEHEHANAGRAGAMRHEDNTARAPQAAVEAFRPSEPPAAAEPEREYPPVDSRTQAEEKPPAAAEMPATAGPVPQPAPAPSLPAAAAAREQLLSPGAGAAVSGAFSALAHTILAQNARTLEDLVSEMLRPMLKDWLDDNLPPLVERLVREEIERVSRGRR